MIFDIMQSWERFRDGIGDRISWWSSVMHFCILDRLDTFFFLLPSHPIHLPGFFSAQGWCWCLLFVSCLTTAALTSRYLSCMFICSYLVLLVRTIHICAWPYTFGEVCRRSVVRFHLCLLIFGSPNRFLRLQTFGLCSPHLCLLLPISHSS